MKRCVPMLALVLAWALLSVGMLASPSGAWYPSATQVELCTATECNNCPDAYDGIEANKGWFENTEFNAIRYYTSDSGGALGNDDSQGRIDYYGTPLPPTAFFNGATRWAGADDVIATGFPYRAIIESLLDDPSYFKITINLIDFSTPTGTIDLDIEVMEDVPDISNLVLRMALTEDNIFYAPHNHQDVTRDMLPDVPITVSSVGQIQNVNEDFFVDPSWVPDELKIIAFVQDDSNWQVLASATTRPGPDYALRYYALGERQVVGPIYGRYDFDWFRVYNIGNQTDTCRVTVDLEAPEWWTSVVCDAHGCYPDGWTGELAPGEYKELKINIFSMSSGCGRATVTMAQDHLPAHRWRTLLYTYISDDLPVLLVDDDGAEAFEDYFMDALDYHGIAYGIWDRNVGPPTAEVLGNFTTVIWSTGWFFPTVDESDRNALAGYLDEGGSLFITGQDIGWEMADIGGAAYDWYQDYLHAIFINDNTQDYTLEGVNGDPVSHMIDLVIEGGDGADNQEFPSDIDPADGSASVIWTYDATKNGAIKVATGVYRVVYLAFGYEAINNAADRRLVMHKALRWLGGGGTGVEDENPTFRAALRVSPNPAQADPAVRFTLPSPGDASLKVFAPDGRMVRILAGGKMDAGSHVIHWDRTGQIGERLPAGIYYYRLETEHNTLVRKAVLLN